MGEAGVRGAAALGLLLAVGGCADRLPVDGAGRRTALAPAGATYTTPSAAAASTSAPVARAAPATSVPPADGCGVAELAYLVGKPRTEIPVAVDLTRRRVVCEGCPVTLDVRSERQTIWYDPSSGKVTRLQCG